MTSEKDLKKAIRARMKATGETYTAAKKHIVKNDSRKHTSFEIPDKSKWITLITFLCRRFVSDAPSDSIYAPSLHPLSAKLPKRLVEILQESGIGFTEFPAELDVDYVTLNSPVDLERIMRCSRFGPIIYQTLFYTMIRHDFYVYFMEDHGIYSGKYISDDDLYLTLFSITLLSMSDDADSGFKIRDKFVNDRMQIAQEWCVSIEEIATTAGGPFLDINVLLKTPSEIQSVFEDALENPRLFSGIDFNDLNQGMSDLMDTIGLSDSLKELNEYSFVSIRPDNKLSPTRVGKLNIDLVGSSNADVVDSDNRIDVDTETHPFGVIVEFNCGEETYEIRNVVCVDYGDKSWIDCYSPLHRIVISKRDINSIVIEPEMVPVVSPVGHIKNSKHRLMDAEDLSEEFQVQALQMVTG